MKSVGIVGAGSWGTALAAVLAENGCNVTLWARRPALVDEINNNHTNHAYLPHIHLPHEMNATSSLRDTVVNKEAVFFVVPSHSMRKVVHEVSPYVHKGMLIVSACKGFEPGTEKRMSEVIKEELQSHSTIAVLSGPSHAEEVVKNCPTTVVVASNNSRTAEQVQQLLNNSYFRVYTNSDVIGVEVGGALKNIIAIAAGLVDGLGHGDNTKAALITRGLAEIIRLGQQMGAKPITFIGLAGMGDLVVTCISKHSRNWKAGYAISQGTDLETVVREMGMVVEGIQTTKAAYALSKKYNVAMPLTEELYKVLFEHKNPALGVKDLMSRGMIDELDKIN